MPNPSALRSIAAAVCSACACGSVYATNGMNMEGYGPIAAGMGGAATAYDNGNAAMANNPATLQLAPMGQRIDAAIGVLGPDISAQAQAGAPAQDSSAKSFVMPAVGWSKTDERLSWGVGVFAQGGMGAEYPGSSPLSAMTAGSVRSELGVGRLIFPLSYRVNPQLTVGASLDYVWAGLDMKMAASADQVVEMLQAAGASAAQANALAGQFGLTPGNPTSVTRLEFSDNNSFTGAAKGSGWGAKLGMTYQASDQFTIGASYHGKTQLSDMKTSASGATFGGAPGQITVVDFQWPATTSLGAAWVVNPKLTLVADIKHIAWSDVMKSFNMRFTLAGMGDIAFAMPQNWSDQTVTMLGLAYRLDDRTTLRAGINSASNPVPAAATHPLFPATIETNYTLGLGYAVSSNASINASLTLAPKVSVVNRYGGTISHSQTNLQLMYSQRF